MKRMLVGIILLLAVVAGFLGWTQYKSWEKGRAINLARSAIEKLKRTGESLEFDPNVEDCPPVDQAAYDVWVRLDEGTRDRLERLEDLVGPGSSDLMVLKIRYPDAGKTADQRRKVCQAEVRRREDRAWQERRKKQAEAVAKRVRGELEQKVGMTVSLADAIEFDPRNFCNSSDRRVSTQITIRASRIRSKLIMASVNGIKVDDLTRLLELARERLIQRESECRNKLLRRNDHPGAGRQGVNSWELPFFSSHVSLAVLWSHDTTAYNRAYPHGSSR